MSFWDAITLVTLAVVGAFHVRQLIRLAGLFRKFSAEVFEPDTKHSFLEFLTFAKAYYDYAPALQERAKMMKDGFLREVVGAFLHGGLVGHDLLRTLRGRVDQKFQSDLGVMHEFQIASRGLPVVGWAVAIISAIWMFNSGPEPISFERAVTAFSVSIGGVLYGLTLTYLFIVPKMEKVWRAANDNRTKNAALVEGLGHLIRKKSVFELYETVQVMLPEVARPQWSEVFPEKMKMVG